jgi:cyanate permease
MVGAAIASYMAGYIHDVAGEYTVAIYFSGLLGLLAATLTFAFRGQTLRAPILVTGAGSA